MTAFDPHSFAARNVLRCSTPDCGHETPVLGEKTFRCPKCRGVYDLEHPGEIGEFNPTEAYMPGTKAFEAINGSSVWAWQDLILPGVPKDQLVTLGEKLTLVRVDGHLRQWIGGDLKLYLLLEGLTPSGAFKDIGMPVAITTAKLAGAPFVICASTGDTSAAAAAYAAAAGIPCIVLLPKGLVTPAQLVQPLAYGARIIEVEGDFDVCMRILRKLVERYGVFPVNSLNPARIEGHQASVFHTNLQLGRLPDWFVLPLGNGSNTTSIGRGQRSLGRWNDDMHSFARILSVQPKNAAPLAVSFGATGGWRSLNGPEALAKQWLDVYQPVTAGDTIATAARIGDPVSYRKVMREIVTFGGMVTAADDQAALDAMFAAGKSGHMVCPQSGLALAGLRAAVRNGDVNHGQEVVVVCTAHGLKFASNFEPPAGKTFTEVAGPNTAAVANMLGLS